MEDTNQLYVFASAAALGADPLLRRPAIPTPGHSSREDLEELVTITRAAFDGQVPRTAAPAPDLSFLPAAPGRLAEPIGRIVVALREILATALRPQPLIGAARGQLVLRYVQDPATTADLGVTIEVYAEDPARTIGRVRVGVDLPGRDPLDMAGSQVLLHADGAEWQSETDETGGVDFTPVPLASLPSLRVEIIPPGQ